MPGVAAVDGEVVDRYREVGRIGVAVEGDELVVEFDGFFGGGQGYRHVLDGCRSLIQPIVVGLAAGDSFPSNTERIRSIYFRASLRSSTTAA